MRTTITLLWFLTVVTLLFLLAGVGLAFQNEPEGFRGLKWGDPVGDNMQLLTKEDESLEYYTLPDDKLKLGDAELSEIKYGFQNGQFSLVALYFKGRRNYNYIKMICQGQFGEPTDENFDWHLPYASVMRSWHGSKRVVVYQYHFFDETGVLILDSVSLFPEYSKAEEKLQTEKAKGDW